MADEGLVREAVAERAADAGVAVAADLRGELTMGGLRAEAAGEERLPSSTEPPVPTTSL